MHPYQIEFIQFCLKNAVINFGDFTLKSGRKCPYFFNAGKFNTGFAIQALGGFYASAIQSAGVEFDVLFGPAYKGIPLVVSTAIGLAREYEMDKPFCFNRKEMKDHGEGGNIVGAPLKGRVLLIDDVITAGTAIRESAALVEQAGAELVGVLISMNRQERGQGAQSAIQEIQERYKIPVFSIITLDHLMEYLQRDHHFKQYLPAIQAYRKEYGVENT